MENFYKKLEELKKNSSFRTIKNIIKKEGKYIYVQNPPFAQNCTDITKNKEGVQKMLNLSSNDYLNISSDFDLRQEFLEKYKAHPEFLFSSASARLLTGNLPSYFKLEEKIAQLFNKEKALLFNTGYQCNEGVVSALLGKNDCIFSDKLNHRSIVSGLLLSEAKHFRYKHLDYDNLETILKKHRNNFQNALIITESVFSMDGDICDIKKLIELKKKYNCLLMVDCAHGFLAINDGLLGISEDIEETKKFIQDIDIITLTLGKALGSMGALCVSSSEIINYLINFASSFIFSTALPSSSVLWSNFLLFEKFDLLNYKREKLNFLSKKARNLYSSASSTHIIPVILGDAKKTGKCAEFLQETLNGGYFVLPINPPTVPKNTSRLRLSLTSDIEENEIENLFEKIKEFELKFESNILNSCSGV